jgi:hypothetical protein
MPLYDAIGRGIDTLEPGLHRAARSRPSWWWSPTALRARKHTHATISELIKDRQAKGWLVIFSGCPPRRCTQQGAMLGIHAGLTANIGAYAKSWAGVAANTYTISAGHARGFLDTGLSWSRKRRSS